MENIDIDKKTHQELFSGYSLKLGQLHWYVLKADNELEKKRYTTNGKEKNQTDLGKEVGSDEIHWWVFKKEDQIDELQRRTEQVLESAQRLKDDSERLSTKNPPNKYEKLICALKEFCESHSNDINDLYNYVTWLNDRNVLAPSILFTYRVWGTTRRSDR